MSLAHEQVRKFLRICGIFLLRFYTSSYMPSLWVALGPSPWKTTESKGKLEMNIYLLGTFIKIRKCWVFFLLIHNIATWFKVNTGKKMQGQCVRKRTLWGILRDAHIVKPMLQCRDSWDPLSSWLVWSRVTISPSFPKAVSIILSSCPRVIVMNVPFNSKSPPNLDT